MGGLYSRKASSALTEGTLSFCARAHENGGSTLAKNGSPDSSTDTPRGVSEWGWP